MSVTRIVNRKINPLLRCLPGWFEVYRREQVQAITEIMRAFDEVDVVVLDAPTGSGKTLIGETVRLMLQANGLYVCHSLGLQDQFARDYPYARVIKGRSNYETELHPKAFPSVSCDDCTWTVAAPSCGWCERKASCPYELAKLMALRSKLAVANSAYALTEWNGPGRFSGRDLVIVDEADTFKGAVREHISVEVSRRRMGRLGWAPPNRVTVVAAWLDWLAEYLPKCKRLVEVETDEKERKYLERLRDRLEAVQKQLDAGLPYAFTGREGAVGFKPVVVDDFAKEAVWKHGRKWLLMSATMISGGSELRQLGWDKDWRLVRMPSTFPVKNRRVHVRPVANMAKNAKELTFEKLAAEILRLVSTEPGRVVVHTVSYSLAGDIYRGIAGRLPGRQVFTYQLAGDRAAAISQYLRTGGSVLVAPSADRGIDLPDDLCRLAIIAKVPYPNLGDRMVSMRLHMSDGQLWYTAETVRSIVQMAGRGVRHKDDWCKTIVLDSQFQTGVWSKGRGLFPAWFKEAIVWEY